MSSDVLGRSDDEFYSFNHMIICAWSLVMTLLWFFRAACPSVTTQGFSPYWVQTKSTSVSHLLQIYLQ